MVRETVVHKKLVLAFQQFLFQYLNDVTQVLSKFQPQLPPEINKWSHMYKVSDMNNLVDS